MTMIICGEDCKQCIHDGTTQGHTKQWKVYCNARNKTYRYGQIINCEDKVQIKSEFYAQPDEQNGDKK